ncbi:MAG: tetratricopeptide repeat protein [Burkholderiales bacterium]|nr:tetratricopeptide repeat protein [Burkholderiales bacterium]
MKVLACVTVALLVSGCVNLAPSDEASPPVLLHDSLFSPPAQPVRAADVFALSTEMRNYLRRDIAELLDARGREKGLYDALYSSNQLKLEYDAEKTRNAAEAFAARSGNCLSLAIMTAAFAKELGLTVRFQRTFSDESWSRAGDFYFASGHVNVTIGRKNGDPRVLFTQRNMLRIDFIPTDKLQHAYDVPEQTIVAMYMNNRAAELLARGHLDEAYWHAREAIAHDSRFTGALNTLGVIYRRHGNLAEGEAVLRYVLAREPANAHAMANLVTVLNDSGRVAEADALAVKLASIEPNPPFHFFHLGMAAIREGDFARARELFNREIDRDAYNHEFHFWLAMSYFGLGDAKSARVHLTIAMENSNTRGEHDLYAAKLDRLRAVRR